MLLQGSQSAGRLVRLAEVPSAGAGEGYMLPFERREVPQVLSGDLFSSRPQRRQDPFEVDRVPQPNSRRQQRQPASAVLLVLVGAVPFVPVGQLTIRN